jgi:hypothetical protein
MENIHKTEATHPADECISPMTIFFSLFPKNHFFSVCFRDSIVQNGKEMNLLKTPEYETQNIGQKESS